MKSRQSGVGLTELIVVIVILVVVAGAAMPRKLGPSEVASAAGAAMTVNYAGCATVSHQITPHTCRRVSACSEARDLLQGGVPAGLSIEGDSRNVNGEPLRCRVVGAQGASAEFAGLAAGH
jgi:MSHA pilin protein MshA